jgi:hypothetical protein
MLSSSVGFDGAPRDACQLWMTPVVHVGQQWSKKRASGSGTRLYTAFALQECLCLNPTWVLFNTTCACVFMQLEYYGAFFAGTCGEESFVYDAVSTGATSVRQLGRALQLCSRDQCQQWTRILQQVREYITSQAAQP